MIVAELIRLLERCDPQAVVLIPGDQGPAANCEPVVEVLCAVSDRFSRGPAAERGAIRLSSFPLSLSAEWAEAPMIKSGDVPTRDFTGT